MKRVLFVDDEPMLLNGLRNMFRRQRSTWDMVFVTSGQEALEQLGRAPFDVVVSDMRMPGLDGAQLLQEISARWPNTACFILSGYADPDAQQRAKAVARACFSKPCDLSTLRSAIEGAA